MRETVHSQEAGNTIGNIPVKWYDKYDHIGYDLNGEKIMRPKSLDAIDKYIQSHDKNERCVGMEGVRMQMDDLRREGGKGDPPVAATDRADPQHPESPVRRARLQ